MRRSLQACEELDVILFDRGLMPSICEIVGNGTGNDIRNLIATRINIRLSKGIDSEIGNRFGTGLVTESVAGPATEPVTG